MGIVLTLILFMGISTQNGELWGAPLTPAGSSPKAGSLAQASAQTAISNLTASGAWHEPTAKDFVQLTVSWTASTGPRPGHYRICIGTTSGGCDVLAGKDVGTATNLSIPNDPTGPVLSTDLAASLSIGRMYYVTVRAVDSLARQSDAVMVAVTPAGWVMSYAAGYTDRDGHYAGGSEIMHLVAHKSKLYAAVGYWMDPTNPLYGGTDPKAGWAQILRQDSPDGQWQVDLDMGPGHLRAELLKSVTFTTDAKGNTAKEPVNLLIASEFSTGKNGSKNIDLFVRDDDTGTWDKSSILQPVNNYSGNDTSVRSACVHRDQVTGVDRLFISLGVLGIYSGVYDPAAPGKIRWDSQSESGRVDIRPLAIIEANGSLFFSSGELIYRRNDGNSPTYTIVQNLSDVFPGDVVSASGGIRGLTAIPNPNGAGESLLFLFCPGAGQSQGCIYRLDPDGSGGYKRTQEASLITLMKNYLAGNPVYSVLGAYNNILPVVDPATNETVYIIGFESFIKGQNYPTWGGNDSSGWYAGAMYAIRNGNGEYSVKEVNGPGDTDGLALESVRAYAMSPFAQDQNNVIYFGGHDCDGNPSHNAAWIFRATLDTALQ